MRPVETTPMAAKRVQPSSTPNTLRHKMAVLGKAIINKNHQKPKAYPEKHGPKNDAFKEPSRSMLDQLVGKENFALDTHGTAFLGSNSASDYGDWPKILNCYCFFPWYVLPQRQVLSNGSPKKTKEFSHAPNFSPAPNAKST